MSYIPPISNSYFNATNARKNNDINSLINDDNYNDDPNLKAYSTHHTQTEQVNHSIVVQNTFTSIGTLIEDFKTASKAFNLDDIITVMLLCYTSAGNNAKDITDEMKNMQQISDHLRMAASAFDELSEFAKTPGILTGTPPVAQINPSDITGSPGMPNLSNALQHFGGWDPTDTDATHLHDAWVTMMGDADAGTQGTLATEMMTVDTSTVPAINAQDFDDQAATTPASSVNFEVTGNTVTHSANYKDMISTASDAATSVNQTQSAKLQALNNNLQADMSLIANILDKMNQLFSIIARIGG